MTNQAFTDQVETLVRLGYPALCDMDDRTFVATLSNLSAHIPARPETFDPVLGTAPFVIVVNASQASPSKTLSLVTRRGKQAVEKLYPKSITDFITTSDVTIPTGGAYVLLGVDRGSSTLNITPDAAHVSMRESGRSPLTIAEGIALLTHFPELLQPNNCFSLLASRCGDKRVPALWLSEARPKLGWCWAGNPHTWLGSASCSGRAGSITLQVSSPLSSYVRHSDLGGSGG